MRHNLVLILFAKFSLSGIQFDFFLLAILNLIFFSPIYLNFFLCGKFASGGVKTELGPKIDLEHCCGSTECLTCLLIFTSVFLFFSLIFALACGFSSSFIFVKILQKRKFLLVKTWGDFFCKG